MQSLFLLILSFFQLSQYGQCLINSFKKVSVGYKIKNDIVDTLISTSKTHTEFVQALVVQDM